MLPVRNNGNAQTMIFDGNKYANAWDDDPDVIAYAERAFACLTDTIDLAGRRVFDFGCGTGLLTERLARHAALVVALDPAARMLEVLIGKALSNVTPVGGLLSPELVAREPALAQPFDLITASSVLAFVPDYAETLGRLRGLLVPGGKLVQWDWLATPDAPDFGFTEAGMDAALSAAGFAQIAITRPFSISRGDDGTCPVLMAVASNA